MHNCVDAFSSDVKVNPKLDIVIGVSTVVSVVFQCLVDSQTRNVKSEVKIVPEMEGTGQMEQVGSTLIQYSDRSLGVSWGECRRDPAQTCVL